MKNILLLIATLMLAHAASATTVVLTPVADAAVYSEATTANGVGDYIFAGTTNSSAQRRSFLRFDIAASVPAGATVTAASLTLFCSQAPGAPGVRTITLNKLTASWSEGPANAPGEEGQGAAAAASDTTWAHRSFSGSSWTTPGGDFSGTASASTAVAGESASYVWTSAAMAADVQGWLDAPATDFGWALVGDESTSQTARRFDSRTNATTANRPALSITYTAGSSVEQWLMY